MNTNCRDPHLFLWAAAYFQSYTLLTDKLSHVPQLLRSWKDTHGWSCVSLHHHKVEWYLLRFTNSCSCIPLGLWERNALAGLQPAAPNILSVLGSQYQIKLGIELRPVGHIPVLSGWRFSVQLWKCRKQGHSHTAVSQRQTSTSDDIYWGQWWWQAALRTLPSSH